MDVPPVTKFVNNLSKAGIPLKENVLTLKDAKEEIYNYLTGQSKAR